MSPEEHLQAGDLSATLKALHDQIRQKPADFKLRVFLFQLLVILGEWEKALNQLVVASELDASAIPMKLMYQQLIQAERLREAIFKGEKEPLVFGQPPEWIALLIQALKLHAQTHDQQAQELRQQAFEQAPACAGQLNDQAFTWIADADMRLGPVLELMLAGRYLWVPFENFQRIEIAEPEDLRDLVWLPAHITWQNGGEVDALIPTRYPFSYAQDDDLLALSRKTIWQEPVEQFYIGYGTRLLTTDQDDYSLLDIRQLEIHG